MSATQISARRYPSAPYRIHRLSGTSPALPDTFSGKRTASPSGCRFSQSASPLPAGAGHGPPSRNSPKPAVHSPSHCTPVRRNNKLRATEPRRGGFQNSPLPSRLRCPTYASHTPCRQPSPPAAGSASAHAQASAARCPPILPARHRHCPDTFLPANLPATAHADKADVRRHTGNSRERRSGINKRMSS